MKKILGALVAVAILIFVSGQDADDAALAEKHYCDMVQNGAWPDYKKGIVCNEEQ